MIALVVAGLASLGIGIALAVLGGGGSILTVPLLVYVLGLDEKSAIATSLVLVGVTAVVAAIQHARAQNVAWNVALVFATTGMLGAYVGGRVAALVPASLLLVLFALLMLGSGAAMWRGRRGEAPSGMTHARSPALLALLGVVVGALTGFVGAGGGFLVVPALALLAGLPMRKAVGTSLVVIALNAWAGFAGHADAVDVDGRLTGVVVAAAVGGSLIGAPLVARVPLDVLRRGFAVVVVGIAVLILIERMAIA